MRIASLTYFLIFIGYWNVSSQTNLTKINNESFQNFSEVYNYTYWDDNWKTPLSTGRGFSNITSSYALNINFSDLTTNSLLIEDGNNTATEGFASLKSETFKNQYSGDINYSILQNGTKKYTKDANPTSFGIRDSQMGEYGTWYNRRFVSTNFTDNAPIEAYYTGIEFTTWHNRFKISFHVQPTANITNGQLQLEFEIPSEYSEHFSSGTIHAFSLPNNKGFIAKPGSTSTIDIVGNRIIVTTANTNLIANESYETSILMYAATENVSGTYSSVFDQESEIGVVANQLAPDTTSGVPVLYNPDEGVHYITTPRYNMGYNNCSNVDRIQDIRVALKNDENKEKRVRLCFEQSGNMQVTGFNSIIRNLNGTPSGIPLQVSKNWHNGTPQFLSENWTREYVELILPANTNLDFLYTRTGAKWGETFLASSHQLSVVGSGVPRGGWLEASIGGFGESVTHSTDYEFGNCNTCDLRPFLVTNQNYGGTSPECGWTGNIGGLDMWVYENTSNTRIYQSEVKTRFQKYSPNLTETSISAVSSDRKLKLDYTFYLNRSDDYMRIYYKVKIKALQSTNFNRLDIFQLGGDTYNRHGANLLAYGNDDGVQGEFDASKDGSNDYTTPEIALTGTNPWVWAGDGKYGAGANGGIEIDVNNGMIIRDYSATFNGVKNNTPYFRERSSSQGFAGSRGVTASSYCIVTPPEVQSLVVGDEIELLVEVAVLPKQSGDYYGENSNFSNALASYGNTYELLYRESKGNGLIASSPTNTISTTFPLTIEALGNSAAVSVTGGRGYVPIVFSGLTSVDSPKLWKSNNTDDCWELVDQSVHGNDFWQADYIPETGRFDLIYNVNRDAPNDELITTHYYLGNNPPETSIVVQTKIGENPWTEDSSVEVSIGATDIVLAPQITELGATSIGEGVWLWNGPNGFTKESRVVNFDSITSDDLGTYTCEYTSVTACKSYQDFEITTEGTSFVPDPNKVYYIDAIYHKLRLASDGESEDPYTTSIDDTSDDVKWQFVDKGNGYWHVQRAEGGPLPRLRTDNSEFADMESVSFNGTYTYYNFSKGYIDNTHFLTLIEGPSEYQRLQVDNNGVVKFVSTDHDETWESFRITEASITTVTNNTIIIQENGAGFCNIDGQIDNNHSGFTGNGFANTVNELNNGMEWEIDGEEGDYTFTWRYAGSSDRPANLLVNGGVTSSNIPFVATGNWTLWTTQSTTRTLPAGVKTMRLQSTTSSGLGNIDYVEITGPNLSISDCSQSTKNHIDAAALDSIIIYPNPVSSTATIQGAANSTIKVYDINGQVLLTRNISNESEDIDTSGLSTGIYYVQVLGIGKNTFHKIIKE